MGNYQEQSTGELVGDFDQYIAFKRLIEGFFNNLDTSELIDRTETALGHPVAIIDLGCYIVGESQSVRNDPLLHREDNPSFLTIGAASALRRHYMYKKIQERSYCSAIIPYDPNPYIAATINISTTNVLLMLVFSNGEELTGNDLINAKKTTQLMTLQFQKSGTLHFYQPVADNRLISKLLDGEHVSEQDVENEKLNLTWLANSSNMRILLIHDPHSGGVLSLVGTITQLLIRYVPLNACILYHNMMLVFLDEAQFQMLCVQNRSILEEFLSFNHLYGIVSKQFPDIFCAREEYRKTQSIIDTNVRFHVHFSLHSEMQFRIIADLLNEKYDCLDFCHPALQLLMEYDRANNSELVQTLSSYIMHHSEQSKVLEQLHIGKSTLFYRLGKIRQLTGVTLSDSEELYALFFSYKLLRTLGILHD